MGNLLFSPDGRITPSEFMRGAIILIAVGALIALMPLISLKLSMAFSVVGLVLIWCWVVLWVKRFHDSGQSGWMSLVPIGVWLVLSMIAGMILMPMFMGDMAAQQAEMQAAIEKAAESEDATNVLSTVMGATGEIAKKQAIPKTIMGLVVSGIVAYVGNMLIKHDPDENQFGPAEG